jgi:hypothetical protein
MIAKSTNMKMQRAASCVKFDVRTCLAPQVGHVAALVLIAAPHSLHLAIATTFPLVNRNGAGILGQFNKKK